MRKMLFAACVAAGLSFAVAAAQETPPAAPPAAAQPPAATPAPAAEPAPIATPVPAPTPAPVATVAPAPAPVSLPAGISPPPAGKGQIVFFRPSRFVGAALSFTVRESGTDLGKLPNGRYFVHVAEPGIHEYEIGRNDVMRMEIEDGETYYAIQTTQMGVVAGRAVLSPSDKAAFETAAPRMRVSAPIK